MPGRLNMCMAFIVLLLVVTSSKAETYVPAEISVHVSILPQKYFVERIGGNRVRVEVMVRPGMSPETYEPTPKQMATLNNADLYFRIAVPFENIWIDKIRSLNSDLRIIECCGELKTVDPPSYDPANGSHRHTGSDAHVWTSPDNAKVLANIIVAALMEFDPAHTDYFQHNFQGLIADLDELDQFIRQQLSANSNRYLLVAHPSWGYFADQYGLVQVAIERHGTEVRARELTGLIEFARANHIDRIYTQKQFDSAVAKMLAREIKATVIELDPLAEHYIDNLRDVAIAISSAKGAL